MEDANNFCISEGGKLFEPRDAKTNKIVTNYAKLAGVIYFWIGIQYKPDDKNYVYVSDNIPVTWTNWANGQPDRNGNCVARGWGSEDTWDDRPCNLKNPFVCVRFKQG